MNNTSEYEVMSLCMCQNGDITSNTIKYFVHRANLKKSGISENSCMRFS